MDLGKPILVPLKSDYSNCWMPRFLYIFRTGQVCFLAFVTGTLFFRTRLHPTDVTEGNLYLAVLFFSLIHMMFNGELPFTDLLYSALTCILGVGHACAAGFTKSTPILQSFQ